MPPADFSFALLALLLALGLYPYPNALADPDTAWHLAAGNLMRAQHAFIMVDPWSFTAWDTRWYNLSWLFDVALSFIVSHWGIAALFGLTLAGHAACLSVMAHHCIRRGAGMLATSIILILSAWLMSPSIIARPQLCTNILIVLFYCQLQRYRESGNVAQLYALPPLMALWANLHGGFITAFPLMGLFLADAIWQPGRAQARHLAIVLALCAAATLVNPYGPDIYTGVMRTLFSHFGQTSVQEWQPLTLSHNPPFLILLVILFTTGFLFDRRTPYIEGILTVTLLVMTLRSTRHAALASLLMMPYFSLRLSLKLATSRWAERIAGLETTITAVMRQPGIRMKMAAFAVCAALALCISYPRIALLLSPLVAMQLLVMLAFLSNTSPTSIKKAIPKALPAKASLASIIIALLFLFLYPHSVLFEHMVNFPGQRIPALEAATIKTDYPDLRFYTDYDLGGYLIVLWRGDPKVFVDGRANSVYSDEVLADHIAFLGSGGDRTADAIADKYQLSGAIISNTSPAAPLWEGNKEWVQVMKGDVATIYLRHSVILQRIKTPSAPR
jgi:hypothetical protein